MEFFATNKGLSAIWNESVSDSCQPLLPTGDQWDAVDLVLNQKVYIALKECIGPEGELLPITVDGEKMYIFHCQSFGKAPSFQSSEPFPFLVVNQYKKCAIQK
ncbi:hypothetical protein [Microbulbifer epialgicus]|uniref:Uncharacterized protein n=1 Tax=Microbulbifer epialgicus TaxID=393907 RepID=A0ABV4P6A8_9GAMM